VNRDGDCEVAFVHALDIVAENSFKYFNLAPVSTNMSEMEKVKLKRSMGQGLCQHLLF
jgi:hypothetical protein